MANLLSGSLHQSFTFTRQNWRGLTEVTIIPLVILAALVVGFLFMLLPLFNTIMEAALVAEQAPDTIDVRAMVSSIVKIQIFGLIVSLFSTFILALASVRIVRFFSFGERGYWRMNKMLAKVTAMWTLYSIGIYFVSMFASMFLFIPLMLSLAALMGITSSIFGSGAFTVIAGLILSIAAAAGMLFIMFSILLRFASGLPIVALDQTPDFFRDMWQQSKGYTFALALRAMAIYALLILIYAIVFAVLAALGFSDVMALASLPAETQSPEQVLEFFRQMFPWFLTANAMVVLLMIPVFFWATVWLAEVNRRLYEAHQQPS